MFPVKHMICKYFLPVCVLSFHALNNIFYRVKIVYFDKVQVISVFLHGNCFWFKKSLPRT